MAEIDPILLHRTNVQRLQSGDVIAPGYPGAGSTLLGKLLLELGVNYVDLYTDIIDDRRRVSVAPERAEYRMRFPPRAKRPTPGRLFAKSHLGPNEFPCEVSEALLLVRDPRDTVYSYHRWRLAFSEEGENRPFADFLENGIGGEATAAQEWAEFYESWLSARDYGWKVHVVRFEDLKSNGFETLAAAAAEFGIQSNAETLNMAIEGSTFEVMRNHEDHAVSDDRRIMRRGLPGEWREWFTSQLAAPFSDPDVVNVAQQLGYEL